MGRAPVVTTPSRTAADAPLGGLLLRGDGLGPTGDVALWLAREGLPVRVLGRVGDDDLGELLRGRLVEAGADVSALTTAPGEATGLVIEGDRHREHLGADADLPAAATSRDSFVEVALCRVSLSTFAPPASREGWLRALDLAREAGARLAVRADFAARPGWSRYDAQAVLTEGLDPVDLLWVFRSEVTRLFPEFWSDAAVLEGVEALGATRTVLVGVDGEVVIVEPGEEPRAVARVPLGDPRAPACLEALVLARWDRGHELLPALEAACHRLPDRLCEAPLPSPPSGLDPIG